MTNVNAGVRVPPDDTARYVENIAKELRTMAGEAGFDFLAYLLAMVEDEAANLVRQAPSGDNGRG